MIKCIVRKPSKPNLSLLLVAITALILSACGSAGVQQPSSGPHDGMTRVAADDGSFEAFDSRTNQWLSPDDFWLSFAENHIAKYWGSSREYPNYADVSENDTLLIQVDQGSCLMEFYHSRWRRAQDVRRWDEKFNEYSGCPSVFN